MGQKWEYCKILMNEKHIGIVYFATTPPKNREFASLDEALAALGSLEWELVMAIPEPFTPGFIGWTGFHFKRPIVPGRAIDQ